MCLVFRAAENSTFADAERFRTVSELPKRFSGSSSCLLHRGNEDARRNGSLGRGVVRRLSWKLFRKRALGNCRSRLGADDAVGV